MAVPAIQTAPTWGRTLRQPELEELESQSMLSVRSPPEQPSLRHLELYGPSDAASLPSRLQAGVLSHPAVATQLGQDLYPGVVEGIVQRITFRAADSGFAVLKVSAIMQQGLPAEQHLNGARRQESVTHTGRRRQQTQPGIVTVTGIFPNVSAGQLLHFEGDWVDHTTHGRQLQSVRLFLCSTALMLS